AEIGHREERRMRMATGIAKFPFVRTLEGFDFSAQPSLDPGQVRDLAACRWIANGDALLVLGPPGVGKTHLAVGLGREAIRLGSVARRYTGNLNPIITRGDLEIDLAARSVRRRGRPVPLTACEWALFY